MFKKTKKKLSVSASILAHIWFSPQFICSGAQEIIDIKDFGIFLVFSCYYAKSTIAASAKDGLT